MLQGEFKHWLNKFPLKWTLWYIPLTHVFNKNKWTTIVGGTIVDTKHPEISTSKNCTAILTQHSLNYYPWLVIDCDALYEATYVCQDNKLAHAVLTMDVKHTCDDDWSMINRSYKCFSVSRTHSALSFNDAQDICYANNSSLFTVQGIHRNTSKLSLDALKRSIAYHSSTYDDIRELVPTTTLYTTLFGRLLSLHSPHSLLPQTLSELYSPRGQFQTCMFFANVNNMCHVVERSLISNMLDNHRMKSEETRGWGVKCRSCSQPLNITGVICEKIAYHTLPIVKITNINVMMKRVYYIFIDVILL